MKGIVLGVLASVFTLTAMAQKTEYKKTEGAKTYKYRLYLHDKKNSPYKVSRPEAFLSAKAIERRKRFGIKVDRHDLPVSPAYLEALRAKGVKVNNTSKWNNTVVVESTDEALLKSLQQLPFVDSLRRVFCSPDSLPVEADRNRHAIEMVANEPLADYYGGAATQNRMLGAEKMHARGFRGEGVTIAVIDGGFFNADRIPGLATAKILGTKNFVNPDKSVYDEPDHGMNVLACIAGNTPNVLVGTAPNASFYLLVSEDGLSEFMVEEDNWCAAVEYADSVGADLITTSLGYCDFDDSPKFAPYQELTGKTHINSRSASLAHTRGLIMVNSGGNSAMKPWKNIGFPADATNILAVGAVRADSINANFSSIGWTVDGRVKPDVTAQGYRSASFDADGKLFYINGTSFSAPITAGAVALLRQACPKATAKQIMDAVRMSGHQATTPDNIFGYGIPNMERALRLLNKEK